MYRIATIKFKGCDKSYRYLLDSNLEITVGEDAYISSGDKFNIIGIEKTNKIPEFVTTKLSSGENNRIDTIKFKSYTRSVNNNSYGCGRNAIEWRA